MGMKLYFCRIQNRKLMNKILLVIVFLINILFSQNVYSELRNISNFKINEAWKDDEVTQRRAIEFLKVQAGHLSNVSEYSKESIKNIEFYHDVIKIILDTISIGADIKGSWKPNDFKASEGYLKVIHGTNSKLLKRTKKVDFAPVQLILATCQ